MYVILAWVSLAFAVISTLVSVVCVILMLAERKTVNKLVARIKALDKALESWRTWYRENFNGGCELPPPPEPVDLGDVPDVHDGRMRL